MRELLGQPRLLERLGERIARGEASHAYLLSGPRSIGKHTLALRVAQTLNCEQALPLAGGCGACLPCRKIESGSHPDVREIGLLEDRHRIGIEQVREMERDIALRPLEGRWRVLIVDDAADLSDDAQDSLLKTLEEPPVHAVLLLVTRAPHGLRPTIISRCQTLPLRPLPTAAIEAFVAERTGDAGLARAVAPLAGGRAGAALELAADEEARSARLAALDELFALVGSGLVERLGWANRLAEDREGAAERLALWLELLRDVGLDGTSLTPLHPDRAERTARLASLVEAAEIASLARLLVRLRDDLGRNSNVRAALELLALRLPYRKEFSRVA